ncbi:MAG: hypothetical protein ACRD8Z_25985 [Nitrososphaeraceae archaeon]
MESISAYDIDLDRFEKTLVCIYDKVRNVIIYWEPIYEGFRGTCKGCPNNWPESYLTSQIKSSKIIVSPLST